MWIHWTATISFLIYGIGDFCIHDCAGNSDAAIDSREQAGKVSADVNDRDRHDRTISSLYPACKFTGIPILAARIPVGAGSNCRTLHPLCRNC